MYWLYYLYLLVAVYHGLGWSLEGRLLQVKRPL
jgi:hypothetical protein